MKSAVVVVLKLGIIYFLSILLGTAIFLTLFWLTFLQGEDILFFKSLIYLIVVCLFIIISLILLKINASALELITYRDILLIAIIFFTINYAFYGLVPFNTSRSVSVMIVGYLYNNRDSIVSESDIDAYIYELYFKKDDAIQRRLKEQIKIGNIEKIEGGYKLTPKGVETVRWMGLITSAYNTEKNYAK